jgi:tRNA-specific adenosine deaminase 1
MSFNETSNVEGEDKFIKAIHSIYTNLGFKPPPKQFTVLAAFFLTKPAISQATFKVISLSTGTKCTPAIKYSPCGEVLHDTHAEVLARRGTVRWLMEEIGRMNASAKYTSDWLARVGSEISKDPDSAPPYRLQSDVSLQLYISTLPCRSPFSLTSPYHLNSEYHSGGDASMGYLASTQEAQMALIKSQSMHLFPKLQPHEASRGRDNYARLGVLRTKPGRADSPPALSMSCSDKIAKWSVLGILGGFGSRFLEPVFLQGIVIGEILLEKQELRDIVRDDCDRALRVRVGKIEGLCLLP